jgi:hypothetical protein
MSIFHNIGGYKKNLTGKKEEKEIFLLSTCFSSLPSPHLNKNSILVKNQKVFLQTLSCHFHL